MIDIGKILQEAREKNKIPLEDLFERTRIPVETIEKIEANQIDELPHPYYLAFVRTLAGEVGCDADSLIKEIQQKTDAEEMDEILEVEDHPLSIWPLIQTFWEKQKMWLPVTLIVIFVITLVGFYIRYGENLFTEPEIDNIEKINKVGADSTGFSIYAIGLEKSILHVVQDTSLSQSIQLQANEKYSWTCEDSIYLELENPLAVALYLNNNQLPFHIEDSTAIFHASITKDGIQRMEESPRPKPKKVEKPQPKKEEPPVVLLGYIDPSELVRKCPKVLETGKAYHPDPEIVEKIKQYNPSMSLLFFIGTWDEVSITLAGQVLSLVDLMQLSGISLSFVGVDQTLRDRAGLVDFHRIQGVPTLLFLSRGNELGRVVGRSNEPIEKHFLNNVEILEMIRLAQPADALQEEEGE